MRSPREALSLPATRSPLRAAITAAYRRPEPEAVPPLARRGASAGADRRRRAGAGAPARAGVARSQERGRSRGPGPGPAAGVFAVVAGRRGADVPRRGAAAHPRSGDARRAHPRQDRHRPVARASRPQPVAVRQRRDLGAASHRQAGVDAQRVEPVERAGAARRQGRRAADPKERRPGDAPDGRAVRHRRDDRRGARQRAAARGAGLPLLVRHARRGGADRRGRGALPARLRRRHRRDRPRLGRPRHPRRAGHLDQAVGAAPALQPGADRPRRQRALSGAEGPRDPLAPPRHRPQHRRRGGRPARDLARPARAPVLRARARRLERDRLRRPGVPEALPVRDRRARRSRAPLRPSPHGPPRQGRVLGQRDQARPGRWPRRLSGLHAQGLHRRRLPGVRAPPARRARRGVRAVRDAQRAHAGGDLRARRRRRRTGRSVRVPVPARHGRAALRAGRRPARRRQARPALPHLRAGRHPRDAARLPRAAPARERRQHLVRQPHRRRVGADRRAGRGSGDDGRADRRRGSRRRAACHRPAASGDPAAARDLRRRATQFARPRLVERGRACVAGGGLASEP